MKVLVLVPLPMLVDRGGAIRIYEQLKILKEKGVDLRCVTYHLGRDVPELKFERIRSVPFYRSEDPGGSYLRILADVFLFIKALKAAREFRPDLIHAHLHDGGLCGLGIKNILGIPVLLDAQGSLTQEMISKGFIPPSSFRYRLFWKVERCICQNADKIITSSYFLKSKIEKEFGVKGVEYFGDGVNVALFKTGLDGTALKREYGLEGKIVIIYTGILTGFQGIDLLLEAASLARRERKDLRFLIIGFPNAAFYKQKAKLLGLEDAVIFTGRKSYFDIPKFLNIADVAVSPKIPEPGEGNLKLFSYMAAGLPSVVLDTPDNRAILSEGGRYCQPTPVSLSRAIIELADNKVLRAEIGQKAMERARIKYSWEKKTDELIVIYEKLLAQQKKKISMHIGERLDWKIRNSYTVKEKVMRVLTNSLIVNNPLYRFLYNRRVREVMAKGAIFPMEVQIESTNICNARCSMCFREVMDRPQGFMEFGLFRKIIDECSSFKKTRLCFSFCGEPLLDPKLAEKIRYAKRAGMEYVYFFTNMSLMDRTKAEDLIASGLDEIKVSMDGFTPSTYNNIRRGLEFEKVTQNLRDFLSARGRGNTPLVTIMITRLTENRDEMKLALNEWQGVVDGIVFKSFDTFARQISPQSEEITFNKTYPNLHRYPCHYPWTQFMILWDGKAVLCCKDFNGKVVLGDVSKNSIREIWRGEKMQAVRVRHQAGNFNNLSLCRDCSYFSIWW